MTSHLTGTLWTTVRLGDDPWLADLTRPQHIWERHSLDQRILVVASISGDEWAAYYQAPGDSGVQEVKDHGRKLPQEVGERLFPLAQLRWRP